MAETKKFSIIILELLYRGEGRGEDPIITSHRKTKSYPLVRTSSILVTKVNVQNFTPTPLPTPPPPNLYQNNKLCYYIGS